jgi:hypothetical protein
MKITRRQLLILAGATFSLHFAKFTHKILSANLFLGQTKTDASPLLFTPPKGDIRIAIISDLNSEYGSTTYEPEVKRAIALIPQWQPDLVLCGGDMIAGQKQSLTEAQIKAMWVAFDNNITAPLRQTGIPFGFTIGNHDASGAIAQGKFSFAKERELATAYWQDKKHNLGLNFIDKTGFPFYYSFTQKGIFYLVWDASTAKIPTEVLTWAEKSLNSSAARQAKIRIAIGHLPLYAVAVGRDNQGNYLTNAPALQALLEKYGVELYISGHHHAYYPGKRGKLELLHAGALGSGPRKLLNSNLPPQKTLTIIDLKLSTIALFYTTYNMTTLQVIDSETLPEKITAPNGIIWRRDIPVAQSKPV